MLQLIKYRNRIINGNSRIKWKQLNDKTSLGNQPNIIKRT